VELYFHSLNTPSWRGAQLKKHRVNYLFTYFSVVAVAKNEEAGMQENLNNTK